MIYCGCDWPAIHCIYQIVNEDLGMAGCEVVYKVFGTHPDRMSYDIRVGNLVISIMNFRIYSTRMYRVNYICSLSRLVSKYSERFLTHWGRVTQICVGKPTIVGSDNGLSPGRRQSIIWTNVGILLIRPSGTNLCEILFGIQTFSFNKMHLKMSAKWRPFCLGPNILTVSWEVISG